MHRMGRLLVLLNTGGRPTMNARSTPTMCDIRARTPQYLTVADSKIGRASEDWK